MAGRSAPPPSSVRVARETPWTTFSFAKEWDMLLCDLRDAEANLVSEVCRDVHVEPELQPTTAELTKSKKFREKARSGSVGSRRDIDIEVTCPNTYKNMKKSFC